MPTFIADDHVPGSFITALRSLGFDVVRSKEMLAAGASDHELLNASRDTGRVVVTCDRRVTVLGDAVTVDHAGAIYADLSTLQNRPEESAAGIDRIVSTRPAGAVQGREFYLRQWL